MDMNLSYDPTVDAWTLRQSNLSLRNEGEIAVWEAALRREISRMRERAYLLVDISGVAIDPAVAESYTRVVKSVVLPRVLGLVRYGAAGGLTSATIRVAAIRNRHPSHLFADRAAALLALQQIRALPETAP